MPAEHRRAVVAAARVAAGQVPAVLPESAPQHGLAGRCQRVGADAHHPAGAVRAVLAVLEEEVQALRRAAGTAGALTQEPRPAQPGGQLIQDPVELTSISPASAARSGQVTRPGWTGPPSVRRPRGPGLAAGPGCRAAFRAAVIRGGRDGEHVTGGADGEPEGASWPWPADAAGRDRVAQRPRVRPGGACHLLPEYVGRSVPGLPCPQPGQARHAHRRQPCGGCGLHLRADRRQLGSPVIVILRSHPRQSAWTAERIHFNAACQGGVLLLRPPGSCSTRTCHVPLQLRHDPSHAMVRGPASAELAPPPPPGASG